MFGWLVRKKGIFNRECLKIISLKQIPVLDLSYKRLDPLKHTPQVVLYINFVVNIRKNWFVKAIARVQINF